MERLIIISRQSGLSLVELLVGMAIGLLATLVIMQAFSDFEGQRRSTSGSADAQTNGSIALMSIQREVQSAGFGLSFPMADKENNLFRCDPFPPAYDTGAAGVVEFPFPVEIENGADDSSDILIARYTNKSTPPSALKVTGTSSINDVAVKPHMGCNDGDIVLLVHGNNCALDQIENFNDNPVDPRIDLVGSGLTAGTSPLISGARLVCLGKWGVDELVESRYEVNNNQQLLRNGDAIIDEVVSLQAQYGVAATTDSNQVTQWVEPTGQWSKASLAANIDDRNRIRAVRVAVIARNGLREKEIVTDTCTTDKGIVNNGPCAWDDTDYDESPKVDLSLIDDDWQFYRYRAFDTIIPLRNMLWSKDAL